MVTIQRLGRASGVGSCRSSIVVPKSRQASRSLPVSRKQGVVAMAAMGGDEDDAPKRSPLSREAEPEQYWSSPAEQKGANPFKDPVAIIGIVSILFPFAFVVIAIATGAIDTSVYR